MPTLDADTRAWIRNPSDEKAAANGCTLDVLTGAWVVWWIEHNCRLYEGEQAGEPLVLHGCHECGTLPSAEDTWNENRHAHAEAIERAARFNECVRKGHAVDWQYECTMRMFGWQKFSPRWGRKVRRFRQASIWVAKKNKKAICLETEVPTPAGFRRFGDLAVGDELFDEAGAVCRVTRVSETWTDGRCYRVTFSDGASVVADADHLWKVEALRNRYAVETLTTEEIATQVDVVNSRGDAWAKNYRIRTSAPIQTKSADLLIPPYTLGVWLGDGDSDGPRITNADKEVFSGIISEGIKVGEAQGKRGAARRHKIGADLKGGRQSQTIRAQLRKIGVLFSKHIPEAYLFASQEQREKLLQGIMDSDGHISRKGQCIVEFSNKQLAEDVRTLIASLGYKPLMTRKRVRCQTGAVSDSWRIHFHARSDRPCCTIARKVERLKIPSPKHERSASRHIMSVEPVATVPVRCISVDSPSQLFLVTRSFIPTHNSPTLASWGWYLLVGDSEPGQKVFFFAKNGEQARKIAGEHAVAMYHQLPEELHDDCKLNQTTYRITHLPSLSWMEPNSSGHSQHKEAKEGLNGSLLIDETHVVDRDLLKIISRAGISRSEPLHIEVSTAGNDPESYGKERFDYALQVLNGEREDEKLFAAVYAAPQNLTDEELATDPMKYARMANPALGHTVDADELLDDYRTSQGKGVSEFADCKMYRFNLWQQTSNPWIDSLRWDKCRREFTEKDLIGRRCVAGLDLSRTRDTTALVLAFEGDDGGHYLWPYFWLPEDRAREIDHKTPVLTWARSGHLELTPGGVVDYGFIVTRFIELHTIFGISELVYDPRFAEEPTQWMSDGLTDPSGKVIFKGTGVPRHPFDQSDNNFAVPTDDFEKLVIAGKLWHNGHPVLAAQVGRATATVRPFTKVKRVKKPNDPVKSVDGVIAAIMALGRLMQAPQPQYNPSWLYD